MLHSLRSRLIVSHVLPVLVIIPLVSAALVYLLETQMLLTALSGELTNQARLLANMAATHDTIWHDSAQAREFVARHSPIVKARIMVLDANGYLIASSDPADGSNTSVPVDVPGVARARAGETHVEIYSNRYLYAEYVRYQASAEVTDVLAPVVGADNQVVGIIRLTNQISHIDDRFQNLRLLTLSVVLIALAVSVGLGYGLAVGLARPLRRATEAVDRLASGRQLVPVPVEGPDEIRQLARAVNTFNDRLHAMEEARRQLLANLVHELGRPLGALRSAIQALRSGADRDPDLHRDLLIGMDEEAGRLQRLLDDLARLYDKALGALEIKRQTVSLTDWLPTVLAPWRQAAEAKNLTWIAAMPESHPIIEGDPDRLAQALGNLLSNAVKYTPTGGSVSVQVAQDVEEVHITISDTGPGIDPDEIDAIFQPFYRGRCSGHFPQGMGLGLTIARDLIAAHGGRIEVASTPGQGSHFTMSLPLDSSVSPHKTAIASAT
jgi:signal transduction histidine kinase